MLDDWEEIGREIGRGEEEKGRGERLGKERKREEKEKKSII